MGRIGVPTDHARLLYRGRGGGPVHQLWVRYREFPLLRRWLLLNACFSQQELTVDEFVGWRPEVCTLVVFMVLEDLAEVLGKLCFRFFAFLDHLEFRLMHRRQISTKFVLDHGSLLLCR